MVAKLAHTRRLVAILTSDQVDLSGSSGSLRELLLLLFVVVAIAELLLIGRVLFLAGQEHVFFCVVGS